MAWAKSKKNGNTNLKHTFKTLTPIYVLKQSMCPKEREIGKTLYGNQKFKKWYRTRVFDDLPPELR